MARPRLSERLDRGSEARLTLVSAPAGFGKTTLLAEWLTRRGRSGRSVAWLSLDEGDNDPGVLLDLRGRRAADGRRPASARARWRCCPRQAAADRDGRWPRCSTSSAPCRARSCWCSTTTTSSTARDVHAGVAFLLDHLPPTAAPGDRQPGRPAAAAGPAARARRAGRDPRRRPALHRRRGGGVPQRGDGPAADAPRRRGAGGAHRGLDRRAAAGRALDAGARRRRRRSSPASPATTATSSTTWSRRCCSASPTPVRELPAADLRPGPAQRAAVRRRHRPGRRQGDARGAGAGQPVPGPAGRPPPAGTATTTCSPTCCRPACSTSSPTQVPELHRRASEWYERATASRSEAIRHALAGGDFDRAADLVELADARRCGGTGRRRRCAAGSRRCPTRWCAAGPVLGNGFVGALMSSGEFDGVEDAPAGRRAVAGGGRPRRRSTGRRDGGRRRGGVPPAAGRDRAVPGRAGARRTATSAATSPTPSGRSRSPAEDDDLERGRGRRRCSGLASWATGDLEAAHAAYVDGVDEPAAGRARLRRPRLLDRAGGHPRRAGPARRRAAHLRAGAAARRRRRARPVAAGDGGHARRHERARTASATTWTPRARHLAAQPRSSASTRAAAEPLPLARRDGAAAARPTGTSTARSSCSTRRSACTSATSRPNVRPVPALRARLWIGAGDAGRGARLGPRARPLRRRRPRPTCASTSTSPWPGCCWPRHAAEPATTCLDEATGCWSGCSQRPRRAADGQRHRDPRRCRRCAHRPAATPPPRSHRCNARWRWPSRRATSGSSWTRDRRWPHLLASARERATVAAVRRG